MNTKDKGLIGESYFIYLCSLYGIRVLEPRGDNCPYDFVIELNGEFKRVQVKSSTFSKNGSTIFGVAKSPSYKVEEAYTKEDCDLFFLYDIERKDYAIVPIEEMPVGCRFQLRFEEPKIKHPSIKYFKDYKIESLI